MESGEEIITKRNRQPPTRYTLAFKLHAIRKLEIEGKSIVQVARELGLSNTSCLSHWRAQKAKLYEQNTKAKPSLSYRSELSLAKKALQRMRSELDILKKAYEYFVSQVRRGTRTYQRPVKRKKRSQRIATHFQSPMEPIDIGSTVTKT